MFTQLAQYYRQPMMHSEYDWLGAIFMFVALGLLVGAVIWAVRYATNGNTTHHDAHTPAEPAPRNPLDIAKERYAKGEITKEELADIRKELAKTE